MPLTKHSRNIDGTYGPTLRGHFYISKEDHRRTSATKTKNGVVVKNKWSIAEGEEFSVFKIANEAIPEWWFCDENNCLFGFVYENDKLLQLGQNEEQLAKFPNDRNFNDPWHGYPVSSEKYYNRPSSALLDKLVEANCISDEYRLRIEKGRI